MSDPTRWADGPSTDVRAQLFRAGGHDAPPQGSNERALAALGLGASPTLAGPASTWTGWAAAKGVWWLVAMGGLGAVAVAVGMRGVLSHTARPTAPRGDSPATHESRLVEPPAAPPAPAPLSSAAADAPVVDAKPPTARAVPGPRDDLGEELGLVDRARQSLDSGDGSAALRALDRYTARFPRGRLEPEATVLRAETLGLLGDLAGARSVASAFLAAHPGSPYDSRLRRILGH